MKVTIFIEDREDGNVRVRTEPSCEQMTAEAMKKKQPFTPAQFYAFKALEMIVTVSKGLKKMEKSKIITPYNFG